MQGSREFADAAAKSKRELAACFEEWMRRYTSDPSAFDTAFQQSPLGYGTACVDYIDKIHGELFGEKN